MCRCSKIIRLVLFFFMIICSLLAPFSAHAATDAPPGIRHLDGKWEFYWQQLLTPADFARSASKMKSPLMMPVGQPWNMKQADGGKLPRFGYATYRTQLQVSDAEIGHGMVLFLESVGSAYTVWINGEEVAKLGLIGTKDGEETPWIRPKMIHFTPQSNVVGVVIQVSNASFRDSGIYGEVVLGPVDQMTMYVFRNKVLEDLILTGALLTFAAYSFIIFYKHRREREALWLGLVSLLIAMQNFMLNKLLVFTLFPLSNWEMVMKLQVSCMILAVISLVQLNYSFYPKEFHRSVLWLMRVVLGLNWLYVLFSSTGSFTSTYFPQKLLLVLIFAYLIGYVGVLSIVRKRQGATLHAVGVAAILFVAINDSMNFLHVWDTILLAPYGLLVYLLAQAVNLSHRYAHLYESNLEMTSVLQAMNSQLEEKIAERTWELKEKNAKLLKLNQQRARLMANVAHDIGSPMAGVQTHLQVMHREHEKGSKKDKIFVTMLSRIQTIRGLARDLLDLSKLESKQLRFDFGEYTVGELWLRIQQQVREREVDGQVLVALDCEWEMADWAHWIVQTDLRQMDRVVQNYVDNGIKFSKSLPCRVLVQMERVEISRPAETFRSGVRISITDDGRGISETDLSNIFERYYKSEAHSKGSGLGLAIVREIVEQHGGTVGVTSQVGQGSTFSFTLPIEFKTNP